MKIISVMLTAPVLISMLLTGCGFQQEGYQAETEMPPVGIATIPVETKPVVTESPDIVQNTELSTENLNQEESASVYSRTVFDKAMFAALLKAAADDCYTDSFYVGDVDKDGYSELVATLPYSESTSANLLFDDFNSAGLYYYGATGAANDYFVINPETGDVYLNENTRSEDSKSVVSREYFKWKDKKWDSACMLYGGRCYWDYENTSSSSFSKKASALKQIKPAEDIFNIFVTGTTQVAADELYKYLSKYFALEHPFSVDIDSDGKKEQVLFIQNMNKAWCTEIKNLYTTDGYFNPSTFQNMHTTCFVLDEAGENMVRIRSENFDRKYRFVELNDRLFAYDENDELQTFQYSDANSGVNTHFMSMVKMW